MSRLIPTLNGNAWIYFAKVTLCAWVFWTIVLTVLFG